MNKLSIALYLADVLGNLQGWFISFFVLSIISLIIQWFALGICYSDAPYNAKDWKNPVPKPGKFRYILPVVFGLLAGLMPSTNTMYLIAGSEAGQVAIQSELGQKVMKGVDKAVDYYTDKLTKKEKAEKNK